MPDLLSHAFIAVALATLLSWDADWVDGQYVTVVMAGAFVPDVQKV